jgi:hypothetical protein
MRYKEHIHVIRNNKGNSGYSNYILNMGHAYGRITDTMDVKRTARKGRHLNTLEKYHIYKISRNNLHMNNTYIDTHNPTFQIINELYDRQQHTHQQNDTKVRANTSTNGYKGHTPDLEKPCTKEHVSTQ